MSGICGLLAVSLAFAAAYGNQNTAELKSVDPLKKAERTVLSPNGAYEFCAKEFEAYKGHMALRWTFSARSVDPDGDQSWHKLWDRMDYSPDDGTFVSDSGRVLQFSFINDEPTTVINPKDGSSTQTTADLAAMYVWDTDGREMAGLDLLSPYGFSSNAEVRKGILMSRTEIDSSSPCTRTYKDLVLPYDLVESYTIKFADGSHETYNVIQNQDGYSCLCNMHPSHVHPSTPKSVSP
jgi:hypothetical protein